MLYQKKTPTKYINKKTNNNKQQQTNNPQECSFKHNVLRKKKHSQKQNKTTKHDRN